MLYTEKHTGGPDTIFQGRNLCEFDGLVAVGEIFCLNCSVSYFVDRKCQASNVKFMHV